MARWACPIHMPSIRNGITSMASRRLKAKNAPSEREPEMTMPPGREQDERLRDEREEREQRDVDRALAVRRERPGEHGVGRCGEVLRAPVLLRERLHDVHAGDRLLRDDGHLRERLLDVAQDGMRHAAVAVRREGDDRRDRECDQGELPRVEEEDDGHDEDRHDVLGEEDEPVAEEEADGLEVHRRAGHQLTRLAAVVEAEREPQEVRVELVAEVVLDPECLPPRR